MYKCQKKFSIWVYEILGFEIYLSNVLYVIQELIPSISLNHVNLYLFVSCFVSAFLNWFGLNDFGFCHMFIMLQDSRISLTFFNQGDEGWSCSSWFCYLNLFSIYKCLLPYPKKHTILVLIKTCRWVFPVSPYTIQFGVWLFTLRIYFRNFL